MKCRKGHEIQFMRSGAGLYLGTKAPDPECGGAILPYCRCSLYLDETKVSVKDEITSELIGNNYRDCMENISCNNGRGCIGG